MMSCPPSGPGMPSFSRDESVSRGKVEQKKVWQAVLGVVWPEMPQRAKHATCVKSPVWGDT